MVTSPTGKGVIVMGGLSSGRASIAMFELSQSMEWTRFEQTLQIDHWAPLAIPIPDELVRIRVLHTVYEMAKHWLLAANLELLS